MPNRSACALLLAGVSLLFGSPVFAQSPGSESTPAAPATTTTATPAEKQAGDTGTKTVEIDQTVIPLPTTLRLKRHHSYFRLTHRFTRDITAGDFGGLAEEAFSLDDGAIIGLEYRFGLTD